MGSCVRYSEDQRADHSRTSPGSQTMLAEREAEAAARMKPNANNSTMASYVPLKAELARILHNRSDLFACLMAKYTS
jgi:hypothetical protein